MSKGDLESCVVALKGGAEGAKEHLSEHDLKALHEKADEVIIWLHKNKCAEGHHYAEKLKELENFVTPINHRYCDRIVPVPY